MAVTMAGWARRTAASRTAGEGYREVPSSRRLVKVWPYRTSGSGVRFKTLKLHGVVGGVS